MSGWTCVRVMHIHVLSALCISSDMYVCTVTVSLCKCVCHPYKAVYPGSGSSHCCSAVKHQNDPCLLVGDSQSSVAT